tara:strand:- start:134 stop:352 length:219 start_codon:yes stop_codon:yes gene_type:complete
MTIAIVNERLAIMVLTTLESSLILLDNLKKANKNHPFIGIKEEKKFKTFFAKTGRKEGRKIIGVNNNKKIPR